MLDLVLRDVVDSLQSFTAVRRDKKPTLFFIITDSGVMSRGQLPRLNFSLLGNFACRDIFSKVQNLMSEMHNFRGI